MKTVKGKWIFNSILNDAPSYEEVNFTVDGNNYVGMQGSYDVCPVYALAYFFIDEEYGDWVETDVYYFEEAAEHEIEIGWWSESDRIIDFGEEEQEVSDGFYDWLVENATKPIENTQISITENGTTTLATAGKYCDRNIDVEVDVPKYDDELVDVTITEFINSTVEAVGVYGLGYKGTLKKVDLSRVKSIGQNAFYNDRVLDTLIIRTPEVCAMKTAAGVFKNTKIESGTGFIYVPDNLVDSYKAATNWATYADQIKPISELRE